MIIIITVTPLWSSRPHIWGVVCGQYRDSCNVIYCDDQNQSGVGVSLPSHRGILHVGEVIGNMTYFPCLPSLFFFFLHTLAHQPPRERRDSASSGNLHGSLFKQHLFGNDRSRLHGEWCSIFNWMFTWGITSTIWIRYHWTICTAPLRLVSSDPEVRDHEKDLQKSNQSYFEKSK